MCDEFLMRACGEKNVLVAQDPPLLMREQCEARIRAALWWI
jgi:hypothetical protein